MLSKALTLDGEEVVGYYVFHKETRETIELHQILDTKQAYAYEIDPSTLKHSHDGGKTFYSSEEINRALDIANAYDESIKRIK